MSRFDSTLRTPRRPSRRRSGRRLLVENLEGRAMMAVAISGLLGSDLTDPENDGAADADTNYNATFAASHKPFFGGPEGAFNVFDNLVGGGDNKWCCDGPGPADEADLNNPLGSPAKIWVEANFTGVQRTLTHFTVTSGNDTPGRAPDQWRILGSNDGTNYTPIYTYNTPGSSVWGNNLNQTALFQIGTDFATPAPYSIFRYEVYSTNGDGLHQIGEIEFFSNTVVYVDDSWNALSVGNNIADADAGTGGNQTAVFGANAFASITAAINAVGPGGTIIVNDGTYNESPSLADGKTVRLTGTGVGNSSVAIGALSSVAGTTIDLQANALAVGSNNANFTIAGIVQGSGALTKAGTGVLTLSGANAHSGGTIVSGGVVRPTLAAAIPSNVTVNVGGTFDTNGINLASRDFTIAGPGAAGQIGAIVNSAGAEGSVRNVVLTGNATIGTNAGKLNSFGPSVNGGGNTLTIAGGGETNIRVDNALQNLAGISVNTTGGGRLRLESSQAPAAPLTISVGPGSRLDSWPTRTYSSNLTVSLNSGILEANGPGGNTATWNGPIQVAGNSFVVANQRIDFFGPVSGAGTITKTGGDVFNVRGGVNSLGGLIINQGRVRFEGTGFGAWTGPITINPTGILSPYNSGTTVANITLAGGTVSIENGGTATYGGVITVTSPSTVDAGVGSVNFSGTVQGTSTLNKVGGNTATISGTLSPGAAGVVGQLSLTGGLNLTGDLAADIGAASDLANVVGTVNLTGSSLVVNRLDLPHAPTTVFVLINNDAGESVIGTFAGLAEGEILDVDGEFYRVTYVYNGNDVALLRNDDLTAEDDSFEMLHNTSLTDTVAGNDTDNEGDGLYSIDTEPVNGTVTLDPVTGEFTYTPDTDFIGTDSFVYLLSDGEVGYDQYATVTIKVTNILVDAAGVLFVNGGSDDDRIVLQAVSGGRTLVRYNNAATYWTDVESVIVFGQGGADTITVSGSLGVPVAIYGGADNDYIAGGSGVELLDGGEGNDRLLGGGGNDFLYGGGGNDTLSGGVGNDLLDGDRAFDISENNVIGELLLAAVEGRDNLTGDAGNDVLLGWGEIDTLSGGTGDDLLIGGGAGDSLKGSYGDDVVYGGDLSTTDDGQIMPLVQDWFDGNVDAVIDALYDGLAADDLSKNTLNGESDADTYLLWALDVISLTAEKKAPNTSIKLYE